jgi:gliding motility-associated-like protein
MRTALLISFFSLFVQFSNAQLIINEVSQGTGSKEYVELLVAGPRACQAPIPTVDLRGIVLDDNNGYFNTGSGTGIAAGAVQFALIPFWSAIPQGTIIVIYNDADVNPSLPAIDVSMNDGNCRLVIPVSSTLFNGQNSLPSTSDPGYPPQASWINGGGNWSQISMNNSNDSFQIRASITSTAPSYSLSWGNNNSLGNEQVYIADAGSGVCSFTTSTDTNPLNAANWFTVVVPDGESPGAPNSTQNQAWIGAMNPTCYGSSLPEFTLSSTPSACGSSCTGSASVTITNGPSPFYYYLWSNGFNTAAITDLCPGNYSVTITDDYGCEFNFDTVVTQNSNLVPQALVANESCQGYCDGGAVASAMGGTSPYGYSWSDGYNGANNQDLCPGWYVLTVTDQNGCSATLDITIGSGTAIPTSGFNDPGTHLTTEGPVLIPTVTAGGAWSSSCGNCISGAGVFDPDISGEGTFEVCYTTTNGNCSSTSCDSITITAPCHDVELSLYGQLCAGDTLTVNGIDYTEPGTYSQTFPLPSGCDSTVNFILSECLDGSKEMEIPNVVTPNGDNVNDVWVVNLSNLSLKEGFIVNRWGEVVKTFTDTIEWNGKINDNEAVEGVYFYQLTFYSEVSGEFTKHGTIQVFR